MPPTISVIIPVFREESAINQTLSQLLRMQGEGDPDIIVVDGQTDGSTLRAITIPGIQKMIGPKGRGPQMNLGATVAAGDILLFLHADTRLPPDALSEIASAITPPHVIGGAFTLGIDHKAPPYRLIEAAVRIRTRFTRIPYGDQAIFIQKRAFFEMGGFPEIPIMEDVALMRRIRQSNRRITILPLSVRTSARRWEKEGIIVCTLRNTLLSLLFFLGASPKSLARLYP